MKSQLLRKTFRALDLFSRLEKPTSLKELAAETGINPSTMSRIISDLIETGYMVKIGRRFAPDLGFIRLGQNVTAASPLVRTAGEMIRERLPDLGVNAAFAGLDRDQVVYLFRSDLSTPELPFRTAPGRSNIALLLLVLTHGAEEGCSRFLTFEGQTLPPEECRKLADKIAANRYLHRSDPDGHWNIAFPVEYRHAVYGLSFYGRDGNERNFDRLLFECSLLASRLQSHLNETP